MDKIGTQHEQQLLEAFLDQRAVPKKDAEGKDLSTLGRLNKFLLLTTDKQQQSTQQFFDDIDHLIKITRGVNPRRILDEKTRLPIAKSFMANGNKYIILEPKQCFNLGRMEAHMKLEKMFAFGNSLEGIYQYNQKSIKLFNDMQLAALGGHLMQGEKNLFTDGILREHIAYYTCTLFIVRAGDDITDWDFNTAKEYIKDWLKEGLYGPDFFTLALHIFPDYTEILRRDMGDGSKTTSKKKKRGNTK